MPARPRRRPAVFGQAVALEGVVVVAKESAGAAVSGLRYVMGLVQNNDATETDHAKSSTRLQRDN
jgi:hypothetical protein